MDKHHLIIGWLAIAALLLCAACSATTTTTKPKMEQVKDSWNNVLCTILKVLEYAAIGIAVLMILASGLKYMTAEDPQSRQGSKNMIVQVFAGLILVFSAVQIVNYLATGTKIESFDMNACNVTFATSPTTTTLAGGSTSSTVSTSPHTTTSITSSTPTTSPFSPDPNVALHQIRACEMAQEFRHLEPGEDLCDVISVVPAEVCCGQLGKCCPE